jgi:hypothetical protein
VTDYNPLDHLPDPEKRFKVLAYTRGAEIYIEIVDVVRKTGVVMDLVSALRAAADINLEATRIMDVMATQMEQGTIPLWKQFISEWEPPDEDVADKN